jgi:hypothetical protein
MSAEIELLRLYLADPAGANEVFTDAKLQTLLDNKEADVGAAAAEGWRIKAASVADWYQMNIDGAFLSRDQVWEHCMKMAAHFDGRSGGNLANIGMDSGFTLTEAESEFS